MDGETRAKLAEIEAAIAELENRSGDQRSEIHEAVQRFEARHENVLLREALKTSNDLYAEHVKRCEAILSENTDRLRAQVGSLQGSNAQLSNTIGIEIEKTQSAARNVIAALNAELTNTLTRTLNSFAANATEIEERYKKLAKRREWFDGLVIIAAAGVIAIVILIARHVV